LEICILKKLENIILKIKIPALPKDDLEYQAFKVSVEYFDVLSSIPGANANGILTISRPNTAPADQKTPILLDMQKEQNGNCFFNC